ncbi:MAG: TRM11 family SAM-dependent methyltransferase, partial [Candidatus Heimdallarchaeaceae archaeon]
RYSQLNDLILDPMVGSGTTIIEAKLIGRNSVGIDINKTPLELAKERIKRTLSNYKTEHMLFLGDARKMDKIKDNSVDLICTHPPYLNIIKYSENNPNDLSQIGSVKLFITEMNTIAEECFRVLKEDKFLAILIGDTRKSRHYIPLSAFLLKTFLDTGFILREDIIKHQWNCASTPQWRKQSLKYNFHLIMHEHLYVFRKPRKDENLSKIKYSSKNNEIF